LLIKNEKCALETFVPMRVSFARDSIKIKDFKNILLLLKRRAY